jgi:CelD/BcsL family acetyltransferase involved in cellulose biosynthesis
MVLYQSPAWFRRFQRLGEGPRLAVAVAAGPGGAVAGLAPLHVRDVSLDVYGLGRRLWGQPLRVARVLGGIPLGGPGAGAAAALVDAVLAALPAADAVDFGPLPRKDSLLAELAGRGQAVVEPSPDLHLLPLPDTFAEHLARYSHKRRYNFRREARLLGEAAGGLTLLRADDPPGLRRALDAAESRLRSGPPGEARAFYAAACDALRETAPAADLSVLRSYCLLCGSDVAAFVAGYQLGGVYYVQVIGANPSLARFSPGSVAHYLVVEDLLTGCPPGARPRAVNYGFGSPAARHHNLNVAVPHARVLLLRGTLANAGRVTAYRGARLLAASVGWVARRLRTAPARPARPHPTPRQPAETPEGPPQ